MTLNNDTLLDGIPKSLRTELLKAYNQIIKNFIERRWEPSELNGGKLCEVVYTILKGYTEGSYPDKSSKPQNMVDACKALEQTSTTLPRSVRIQIPRMLISLYEIRNNRGVGHTGGDVDPNYMDATCVVSMSKWIMADLVRLYHNVSTEEATIAVNSIVERIIPLVWEINGKKRILEPGLSMKDKTLLLLYHSTTPLTENQLVDWIEHSNASTYRRDILRKAHKEKLLEYDSENRIVHISPKGREHVEENILTSYTSC